MKADRIVRNGKLYGRYDRIERPDVSTLKPDEQFKAINEWWDNLPDKKKAHVRLVARQRVGRIKRELGIPFKEQ